MIKTRTLLWTCATAIIVSGLALFIVQPRDYLLGEISFLILLAVTLASLTSEAIEFLQKAFPYTLLLGLSGRVLPE